MEGKAKYVVKIGDLRKGIVTNQNVRRAIVKEALFYWKKLPLHTRSWYTIGDMIQEGINHVVTKVAKKYKKDLAAVITLVVHAVRNHYINIVKFFAAAERNDYRTVSLATPTGENLTLLDSLKVELVTPSFEDRIISRIDGEKAFLRIYDQADHITRKYIIKWLMQPRFSRNKKGDNFHEAFDQFKALANMHRLTHAHCVCIMSDEELRTTLAKKMILRFRTPKRNASAPVLRESLEGELVPLL